MNAHLLVSPQSRLPEPRALCLEPASRRRRLEAPPEKDDGILTAEEISTLDLQSTRLAVLSACETGLGELRAGEGVLGIRRAFEVAGARSMVMSLWSVEDEATRQWMLGFYGAHLTRGRGVAEAARETARELLKQARGASPYAHPFFWGAFVTAGDWR